MPIYVGMRSRTIIGTLAVILALLATPAAALALAPHQAHKSRKHCAPAAFPSVLRTDGRTLVDANGCTLPLMKGFSIQIGPWSQATMYSIAAQGVKLERLLL